MTQLDANADLTLMASAEAMQLGDLGADDPLCQEYVKTIQTATGSVARETGRGTAEHARLSADNMSNPIGIAERLQNLPNLLDTATDGALGNVDLAVSLLRLRLGQLAVDYDGVNDATLRDELHLLVAHAKPNDGTLVGLARNSRYASILASPFGKAMCQNLDQDYNAIFDMAVNTNRQSGTPKQRAAAAAHAGMHRATRVLGLSQHGARNASDAIKASNLAKFPKDRGYNGPSTAAEIRNENAAKARR
jgi:hypothetical protein